MLEKFKINNIKEFKESKDEDKIILITHERSKEYIYHFPEYCHHVKEKNFENKVINGKEKYGRYYAFSKMSDLNKFALSRKDKIIRPCKKCGGKGLDRDLVFVENILEDETEEGISEKKYTVVTLNMSKEMRGQINNEYVEYRNINEAVQNTIQEGRYYVHSKLKNQDVFMPGNKEKKAKEAIDLNLYLIENLAYSEVENDEDYSDYEIHSYHVNVGHANCSFLLLNKNDSFKLWMIDGGGSKKYRCNIFSCLKHLKQKINKDITFSRVFITHPHHDHYEEILDLFEEKYITNQTKFYINFEYPMPNTNYNELLSTLKKEGMPLIKPVTSLKTNNLEILYPESNLIEIDKINNLSVLYHFQFGKKNILFPGDLETKKWNELTTCENKLDQLNYYCISHHGSKTGHLRTKCPKGKKILSIADCVNIENTTCIVMGKDGRYSEKVLQDFNYEIIFSEYEDYNKKVVKKFLEIDWETTQKKWY